MVLPDKYLPDCNACCGLCCVAHSFETAQGFAYDKPAQTPCVNLQSNFRCSIHDRLAEQGFPGCVTFDCYGAGQWVTQHMFQGARWTDSEIIGKKMFTVFSHIRILHELMLLLYIAKQHVEEKDFVARINNKLREIEDVCKKDTAECIGLDITFIRRGTMELLRELGTAPEVIALSRSGRLS